MKETFTPYQRFVVALLAFLQFTIVVDFMILSPLGALLMQEMGISTAQFGVVVSAYALSAGVSSLLAAGFADRFDRRRFLLFFYVGFVVGTFLCGLAPTYELLLLARIVTGLFGGVIGSISYAIVADLFPLSMRGRVVGVVQSSFAASQVLGVPLGLYLATHFGWHMPFLMLVAVSVVAGVVIVMGLRPLTSHLEGERRSVGAVAHLRATASRPRYVAGFAATTLLASGGFMLMPFGSAFLVFNLGIPLDDVPMLYMATGFAAMFAGPLLGRVSDRFGAYRVFLIGSGLCVPLVLWYTHLTSATFAFVVGINIAIFATVSARMVSSMSLTSALPSLSDRGAFMSVNASVQQFAGGASAWLAGLLVTQQTPTSRIEGYGRLGFVVGGAMLVTMILMGNVSRLVARGGPADARAGAPDGAPRPT